MPQSAQSSASVAAGSASPADTAAVAAAASSSGFDIEASIQARIADETEARRAARDTLDSTTTKIEGLVARMVDRPRETDGDIVAATKELEFKHATTSQDSASERQFMRDMEKLRRKRAQIIEFAALQVTLDGLRDKRKELLTIVRDKDRSIDDLYLALRKVRTAAKVGCEAAEVVEHSVVTSEEKLPISVFRQISEQFHVALSTSKVGGERAVRVQGQSKDVEAALARIEVLSRVVKQDINVTAATIFCLLMCSATLVHRIESDYNVRIDLSRSNLTCKVIGQPSDVASAVTEIESIQSAEMTVPFELSALPAIIGKGGQGLRAIEEEHSVQVDIDKDKAVVKVMGFVDDVAAAVDAISAVSNDNRNIERCIIIQRHVTMSLLQKDGAAVLKSLRKNHPTVNLKVNKVAEMDSEVVRKAAADYNRNGEHAGLEVIFISGAAQRAVSAYQETKQVVEAYLADEMSMKVAADALGSVVGKKGANIAALREAFPNADVDIDDGRVYIHCPDAAARRAVYDRIAQVVAENQSRTLSFPEDVLRTLVSPKGTDLCKQIEKELKVNMSIDIKSEQVRLRGHADGIAAAAALLSEFHDANALRTVDLSEEDCRALLGGGDDSCAKRVASEYGVEVFVLRKTNTLKLRGSASQVESAATAISKILSGDLSVGSQVLSVDPSDFSVIIGKGGEKISKFQSDNDVLVDILRGSNQLRLRGKTSEGVLRAVKKLRALLDEAMGSSTVVVPSGLPAKEVQQHLSLVRDMFGVKVNSPGASDGGNRNRNVGSNRPDSANNADSIVGPVTLQGKRCVLRYAEPYLNDLLGGTEHYTFQLTEQQYADVSSEVSKPSREVGFKKLGVNYSCNAEKHTISLEGSSRDAMAKAKVMLFRFLDDVLPGQFAATPMSAAFLCHFISNRLDAGIRDDTETSLQFDFPLSTCRISGRPSGVLEASSRIQSLVEEWKERCDTVLLDDLYMIPYIVGKGGSFLSDVQKQTGASVDISDAKKCVDIRGPSREAVSRAKQMVEDRMKRYSDENWRSTCSSDAAAFLIGKAGANIKRIRDETKVSLDIDIATGTIRVSGTAEQVLACKGVVQETLKSFSENNSILKVFAPYAALATIIGKKGATISDVQQKSGAKKVDLSRDSNAIVIRGSASACQAARKLIDDILAENDFDLTTEHEIVKVASAPSVVAEPVVAVVAEAPVVAKKVVPTQLSKSARKRLRKKATLAAQGGETGGAEAEDEESEDDDEEEEEQNEIATAAAPVQVVPLATLEPISTSAPISLMMPPASASTRPFDKAPRSPSMVSHVSTNWSEAAVPEVPPNAPAFTPFSSTVLLVNPLSAEAVSTSSSSAAAAPPVSKLRSMRSARAGMIGAGAVPSNAQPSVAVSSVAHSVGSLSLSATTSSAPYSSSASVPAASTESSKLLSMLLSDESVAAPSSSSSSSAPPPGFASKAAPAQRVSDGPAASSSADGYYRSKGYSVRLN